MFQLELKQQQVAPTYLEPVNLFNKAVSGLGKDFQHTWKSLKMLKFNVVISRLPIVK